MNLQNPYVTIEEILETLPHKFRTGKNVKIILDAYIKQYNKVLESYAKSVLFYNIDMAVGDQLDRIGSNFMVRRDNKDDDKYRESIKLAYAVYKVSGNILNFTSVFKDYLGIDISVLRVYEAGNANVILELNRSHQFGQDIVNIVNDIIKFGKPVGVGFSIEQFSEISIYDRYSHMIELEIDRYNKRYMLSGKFMDDALFMYDIYYMNISIDRYIGAKIEN
ncbi:MAG: hypothetical protein ACRCX2_18435 [Paraclostridium sp.]